MGTPDFAVASLDRLYQDGHQIVGVITSTDKYGGRGKKTLIESAVKRYAVSKGLNILQPKNLKSPQFVAQVKDLKADLQVVVAFRMLPVVIWDMPPMGTMNLHGSLLPKYRGAAPINWAVINGDKVTGLTTFLLKHEIDTGDILDKVEVPIDYRDTVGTLHDKMMTVGATLVSTSVNALETDTTQPSPQDNTSVTHAPKIYTETCAIDPSQSTRKVYNFIRGLNPYPGAYLVQPGGQKLKIFDCSEVIVEHSEVPGSLLHQDKALLMATTDGYISISKLQAPGKRRMSVHDYLNGLKNKN